MRQVQGKYGPAPPKGAASPFDWGRPDYVQEPLADDLQLEFQEGTSLLVGESAKSVTEGLITSFPPVVAAYESLDEDRQAEMRGALEKLLHALPATRWPCRPRSSISADDRDPARFLNDPTRTARPGPTSNDHPDANYRRVPGPDEFGRWPACLRSCMRAVLHSRCCTSCCTERRVPAGRGIQASIRVGR
jgi:hypothetical protein